MSLGFVVRLVSLQSCALASYVISVIVYENPQIENPRCSARFYTPHEMHGGVIYGKFTCHILHPLP